MRFNGVTLQRTRTLPGVVAIMQGVALVLTLLMILIDDVASIYIPRTNDTSRVKHNSVKIDVRNDVMIRSDVSNEVADGKSQHVRTDDGQAFKRYSSTFKNDQV